MSNSNTHADPSAYRIRKTWSPERAKRIIRIMRQDGISYARAVKRSRRRMIAENVWPA